LIIKNLLSNFYLLLSFKKNQSMSSNQVFLDALHNALSVPQKKFTYTAEINRTQPTAFVFLIDQSGSMKSNLVYDGNSISKAQLAADVLNDTLNQLLARATKGDDVREYYKIAIIGYGGQSSTKANYLWQGNLAGKQWCTMQEISEGFIEKIDVSTTRKTRTGEETIIVTRKKWINAVANDQTPMLDALNKANELLEQWLVEHSGKDCYPPTIINITDGVATDAQAPQLIAISSKIKSLHTSDGHVLMFNIHIDGKGNTPIVLPETINELPDNKFAHTLFEMSSTLPARYDSDLQAIKNATERKIYKAMCYNADATKLVTIMSIGTFTNKK
jgi:uncharacterized protein YegL